MQPRAHIDPSCTAVAWAARSWASVAEEGRVALDEERGWHIDFRAVKWPGMPKPKRVRISKTNDAGKIRSYEQAEQILTLIRQRAMSRPLFEILSEYMGKTPLEQTVPRRWAGDFIKAKRVAQDRGEISKEWVDALAGYPRRGYLAFWDDLPVGRIDGPQIERWHEWLRATFPHLGSIMLRHIVVNFRTFCGHLRRVGALDVIPEFPRVKVPKKRRRVLSHESLERVLAEIPETERGLWLARAYAGLRPAEARRVDVRDWDGQQRTLRIRAEICKTDEERILPLADVAPELVQWIATHRASASPWEPLFPSPRARDKRWKATPERRTWIAALEAAGVEHVAPNLGGRHAFATREAHAGTNLMALKDWMGHSSIKTTEIYTHTDVQSLARRMRPVAHLRTSGPVLDQKASKEKENS